MEPSIKAAAQASCETSLGSSSVDVLRTSTSTRVGNLTLTDAIISQRNSIVGLNTTTTTVRETFTKFATVTASSEATIATLTVTRPTTISWTRTATKTKTNTNTITTTSFFNVTISRKPGFTAIRDTDDVMEHNDDGKKTVKVGKDARLFKYPLGVTCTEDMPVKQTVTTTSFKVQNSTKLSTSTCTQTVWRTIRETRYPSGLDATVTATFRPIETAIFNVTKTAIVNETVTVERRRPQSTFHEGCNPDHLRFNGNTFGSDSANLLLWAPGRRMIKTWTHQDFDINPSEVKVDSTVACCSECMKRKYCRLSVWGKPPDAKGDVKESCYLYITVNREQCLNGAQPVYARYIADRQVAEQYSMFRWETPYYTFSNGPCGQLKWGGELGLKTLDQMKEDIKKGLQVGNDASGAGQLIDEFFDPFNKNEKKGTE
ncbi:hypothetical protein FGADI_7553 [Fusarium gaditjirri]|uniref:Apple domain-containing protein n=1 Tax=Fusarium gaditjirri TaxID=282569 RepID=A0A8H4T4T7_9HYPO|nr:hypothetical protein FGADI_7553 [Fusarium gaditjirri]